MASTRTHAACAACYGVLEPGRKPYQLAEDVREPETCCFCGAQTAEGIYYRADPKIAQHCDHREDT
jgi:hypothetical protein